MEDASDPDFPAAVGLSEVLLAKERGDGRGPAHTLSEVRLGPPPQLADAEEASAECFLDQAFDSADLQQVGHVADSP